MTFVNPQNNYTVTFTYPRWALFFFGIFYFLYLGMWKEVAITFFTGGLALLVYCIILPQTISSHYLNMGWEQEEQFMDGISSILAIYFIWLASAAFYVMPTFTAGYMSTTAGYTCTGTPNSLQERASCINQISEEIRRAIDGK